MIKIRYVMATNKVTGWCADSNEFDGIQPRTGEVVAEWNISLPAWPMKACIANPGSQTIELDSAYLPPLPTGVTRAIVIGFQATEKPIRVTRNWQGYDLEFDCYVSQQAFDAYQGGNLVVGDHVGIVFEDDDKDKPWVIDKWYQPPL